MTNGIHPCIHLTDPDKASPQSGRLRLKAAHAFTMVTVSVVCKNNDFAIGEYLSCIHNFLI